MASGRSGPPSPASGALHRDQHARESGDGGEKDAAAHRFLQHQRRHRRHDQGRDKGESDRLGQRQDTDRVEEAETGEGQQQAAKRMSGESAPIRQRPAQQRDQRHGQEPAKDVAQPCRPPARLRQVPPPSRPRPIALKSAMPTITSRMGERRCMASCSARCDRLSTRPRTQQSAPMASLPFLSPKLSSSRNAAASKAART